MHGLKYRQPLNPIFFQVFFTDGCWRRCCWPAKAY